MKKRVDGIHRRLTGDLDAPDITIHHLRGQAAAIQSVIDLFEHEDKAAKRAPVREHDATVQITDP